MARKLGIIEQRINLCYNRWLLTNSVGPTPTERKKLFVNSMDQKPTATRKYDLGLTLNYCARLALGAHI